MFGAGSGDKQGIFDMTRVLGWYSWNLMIRICMEARQTMSPKLHQLLSPPVQGTF